MSNKELSDEKIAESIQTGNMDDFAELVLRYEAKMLRYARKFLFSSHDAQDLVQDVFIKAYVNIQSFDISKKFSSWIYRIAHNEFINAIKKKSRMPLNFFDPDVIFPHPVAKENPERDSDRREIAEMIEKSLSNINIKYREPLILYYLEELSYKEISDIMRVPTATVGVRLRRGKELVKKQCQKLGY